MRYMGLALAAMLAASPVRAQTATDTLRVTLEAALQRALSQSEEMRLAQARVAETRGQVREAFSAALPQVNGTLTYTRQFASIYQSLGGATNDGDTSFTNLFKNSPFGAPNAWNAQLTASQVLFTAGKVGAGLSAAQSARDAANFSAQSSESDIRYQVTQAYLDAQYARRLLAVATEGLDEARKQLDQTRLFRRAGTRAEYDLLRAQVDAANQEPAVVQAANNYDIALLQLKRLINVPLDQAITLATPLVPADNTIPVVAEEELGPAEPPAVAAAEASVKVQQQLLKVAKADRWPSVTVSSTFSEQAFPTEVFPFDAQFRRNWNAQLEVSVPLFNGLRTEGTVARARAQLDQAMANRDQVREQADIDRAQARAELRRTKALLVARRETVRQAEQTHHLATVRYANGISTQLEVSDARLLLQQAEANEAGALRDYLLALAQLERTLGRPVHVERQPIETLPATIIGEDIQK